MAGTQSRINVLKQRAHEALSKKANLAAWTAINDILNIDMDDPQGLYMAAVIMRQKGHVGIAAQLFRRNVALDPDHLNPWLHFGACLHDLNAYDAAIEAFKFAKSRWPEQPQCYSNLAASYVQKGEFAEALNYAAEAQKRDPKNKIAKVAKALACLGLGRWREGFAAYKAMYGLRVVIREYQNAPQWNGEKGKTIVVQGDQGLGDEIMYASVIPDLSKDVKVIYDCHPKLVNVFRRSFPGVAVFGTRKKAQEVKWLDDYKIDASTHVSNLGRWYRGKDKDFPRTPYLVASPERRAHWKAELAKYPRPWVGLAWQGGAIHNLREFRSVDPEDWMPVVEQGGTFIDLSYHDSTKEREKLPIVRFDLDENDYDDTLALLAELDLVISVTTTIVHACGAIGKQALVLVNNMPAWRYGWRRDDMIWYPPDSVRLFRQAKDEPEMYEAVNRIAIAYRDYLDKNFPGLRSERGSSVSRVQSISDREQQPAFTDYAPLPASAQELR